MIKFIRYVFFITVIALCQYSQSLAQCNGARIQGISKGGNYQFNTQNQILAGGTITDYLTLQYSLRNNTNCAGWSLRVSASGDFKNGNNTISISHAAIRFNRVSAGGPSASQIGVSSVPVQLSTAEMPIITNAQAPLQAPPNSYIEHKIDFIIQGGSHLSAPTGSYSTTLTFSLYDQNNNLVSSRSVSVGFSINFSNTCSGTTISAYGGPSYTFSNYAQQMAGATINDAVTVQYNPKNSTCTRWSLKVRANGNFVNGGNSVPPEFFALRFDRVSGGAPSAAEIGVTNTPVQLSMADMPLISQSNAGFDGYATHKFDLLIQGGNHLLVPNGTYSANLTLSLFNFDNQLVSTTNVTVSFQVYSSTNSFTVQLQNTGNQADLVFNTMSSYVNGVNITKTRGLKITGYSPYQVLLKAAGDNLQSSLTGRTIPVSVVSMENTVATPNVTAINTYNISLSSADQVIITNPMTNYLYQSVEYTQKYSTQPGDNRLALPAGTYTGNLIFVVIPL